MASQTAYSKYLLLIVMISFAMTIVFLRAPVFGDNSQHSKIPQSQQTQLDIYVRKYIDSFEAQNCIPEPGGACKGTEYKKARKVCHGDIDGDGKQDIAVLYVIEGFCCGNNGQQYLALFLKNRTKFEMVTSIQVGSRGERFVETCRIQSGKIFMTTKEYLRDDPMCCPSGTGKTTYALKRGKLFERIPLGEKKGQLNERTHR
jgi:hypothetical protein